MTATFNERLLGGRRHDCGVFGQLIRTHVSTETKDIAKNNSGTVSFGSRGIYAETTASLHVLRYKTRVTLQL